MISRFGRRVRAGAAPDARLLQGRVLLDLPPLIYDLASDTFSVGVALDPGGLPGDPGFGGLVRLPDGRVLALVSLTGQMVGTHTTPTEFQALRLFIRNAGADLNSIARGLYLTASLAGGGHVRTAYFRADAEPGATGYLTAAAFAVKSVPELLESVAILVSSEGTPGKNVGVYMNSSQLGAKAWGTGIVIGPSTYAHVQYRTELGAIAAPSYSEDVIALTGAVQDTRADLIPAGVLVRAVLVKAPAGVVVAAGDASNPARFLAATAGGGTGLRHHALGLAAQETAGRVRLTVTGPASGEASGEARVTVFYERYVVE